MPGHARAGGRRPPARRETDVNRRQREAAVRVLLERDAPAVPPGLHEDAARLGRRLLRRHRVALTLLWLLLTAATVALVVWAVTTDPWKPPPSTTTPPLRW